MLQRWIFQPRPTIFKSTAGYYISATKTTINSAFSADIEQKLLLTVNSKVREH